VYIPFRKVHRAFGELRHLSEEECERHLRRARLRETRLHHLPWVVGLVCGAGAIGLGAWSIESAWGLRSLKADDLLASVAAFVGVPAAAVLAGMVGGLLARDFVLLRLLRREVHKARCPKCRQSLLGLPITFRSLGPPEPGDGKVRCPECGRVWVLLDIGLRPTDLVPWDMRAVPADYGKVRRQGSWAGR
jgi:hypothetical protein